MPPGIPLLRSTFTLVFRCSACVHLCRRRQVNSLSAAQLCTHLHLSISSICLSILNLHIPPPPLLAQLRFRCESPIQTFPSCSRPFASNLSFLGEETSRCHITLIFTIGKRHDGDSYPSVVRHPSSFPSNSDRSSPTLQQTTLNQHLQVSPFEAEDIR